MHAVIVARSRANRCFALRRRCTHLGRPACCPPLTSPVARGRREVDAPSRRAASIAAPVQCIAVGDWRSTNPRLQSLSPRLRPLRKSRPVKILASGPPPTSSARINPHAHARPAVRRLWLRARQKSPVGSNRTSAAPLRCLWTPPNPIQSTPTRIYSKAKWQYRAHIGRVASLQDPPPLAAALWPPSESIGISPSDGLKFIRFIRFIHLLSTLPLSPVKAHARPQESR